MTPDAVLQRYVQVVNDESLDADGLARLVGADADLLGRWISLLGCRVVASEVVAAMAKIEDVTLRSLAQAQVWTVMPPGGVPRLSYAKWSSVLRGGCLGEVLANVLGFDDPESVRLQIMLAVSGVQIGHDPLMREVFEFRGSAPELLIEAHPLLRILAVVESQDVQGAANAERLAAQLLGIDGSKYADALRYADASTEGLIAGLGIRDDELPDWSDKLWLQQQVMAFSNVIALQPDLPEFEVVHRLISAELFQQTPMTFLVDEDSGKLTLGSNPDDFARIALDVGESPSIVAKALRVRAAQELSDGDGDAVIDRQLMRRLDATGLIAVPMFDADVDVGVLVFAADEERSAAFHDGMIAYARSVGHWLATERRHASEVRQFSSGYRQRHEKRLREIVHEANNPLAIVHNYLHILELRLQEDNGTTEQIHLIRDEISRAAEIFRQAVEFPQADSDTAADKPAFRRVDLNEIVGRVSRLIGADRTNGGVAVSTNLHGVLELKTDADRLTQVLTNLIKNAVEALGESGTVIVSSLGGVFRAGREGVEVVVADNGPGLPRDVLERLFHPKRSSKGGDHAGLGLHIVGRLVGELEGNIDVRTTPQNGTAFTVFLPLAPL